MRVIAQSSPRVCTALALLAALVPSLTAPLNAQSAEPAPLEDALRSEVSFLASDELTGRLIGTSGERHAAEYLARELERIGLEPLPGQSSLMLPFEFTSGSRDTGSKLEVRHGESGKEWSSTDHVQALSFSEPGRVEGEAVFVGYGLTVPDSQDFAYDSYATLDVADKIVVALRYSPEDLEGEPRATLNRYSGLRYKAMLARANGAKALLLVTGPSSPNAGETVPMRFDTAAAGSGIVAASISGDVAAALFEAAGTTLEEAQKALDSGNPHVAGFPFPDTRLSVEVQIEREKGEGYNVAGMLPGLAPPETKPYVVLGAHFDHLGEGRSGNSLARGEEVGGIHHGADDNASGVSAVLEAARRLARNRLDRHVVVAFWSGEELGLLGSAAFVAQEPIPMAEVAGYLNLDMVGRMRDNRLTVQAVGSSPTWPRLLEQSNIVAGFDLVTQDDPYLPTDSASFYSASVPSLNLFTGGHEDYHRPSDLADRINYEDLARIAEFTRLLTLRLANLDETPEYVKVERKRQQGGDRDSVRAYTGTIPDYTSEVEGLRLGGVVGGGPAEEAGLREGDVIVKFGDQEIKNIYDYTFALDAVKPDKTIVVEFIRDGERLEATIVPRSRK